MAGLAALSWIGDVCTSTLIRVRGEMEDCEDLLTFLFYFISVKLISLPSESLNFVRI